MTEIVERRPQGRPSVVFRGRCRRARRVLAEEANQAGRAHGHEERDEVAVVSSLRLQDAWMTVTVSTRAVVATVVACPRRGIVTRERTSTASAVHHRCEASDANRCGRPPGSAAPTAQYAP